jgi:hypothetical protein
MMSMRMNTFTNLLSTSRQLRRDQLRQLQFNSWRNMTVRTTTKEVLLQNVQKWKAL